MDATPPDPLLQASDTTDPELAEILTDYPDLRDVPVAVLVNVGAYDTDCAGGCG